MDSGTAAERLAGEIRLLRGEAGMSQARLAAKIGYTPAYVSLAERPGKGLPSAAVVQAIDNALDAAGVLLRLREQAESEQQALRQDVGGYAERLGGQGAGRDDLPVIAPLRRVLAAHDLPEDGPVRALSVLERAVGGLVEQRLDARYEQMTMVLPDLLSELLRARHSATPAEHRRVAHLLTAAYRAADGLAFKYGYGDLSARLVDLMGATAVEADDPFLLASVAYVRTETFFATGDLDTAMRALVLAADAMRPRVTADVAGAAIYGSLHMRAAVVAGRAGLPDRADDHLAEARRVAAGVPESVYCGTAFGASSVKIHDVAVAVELGDSPSAVERAGGWQPPRELPAERRSHYYIDLARAHLDIGRYDGAYGALRAARQIAPQHTRAHPRVRQSLTRLARTSLGKNPDVVNYANWVRLTPGQ
jgi:transcriptional regulator with XRE-family HTH domain